MNWYIGQEIVAIRNHSEGAFKEGVVYVIHQLRGSFCGCGHILIDIGIRSDATHSVCPYCITKYPKNGNARWFNERSFKPLDTLADISELTEILETTKPFDV